VTLRPIIVGCGSAMLMAGAAPSPGRVAFANEGAVAGAGTAPAAQSLSKLSIWDDGLAEMCYYRAVDRIHGRERAYIRVHLVNRQWMDRDSGVKADPPDGDAVPVFKLNIAEEIPTENYNYRYLTTAFLVRPDLDPFKLVVSSQEWCGATFKHLRWTDAGVDVQSFSYFGGEGDRTWRLTGRPVPYEALVLIARDVAAAGQPRDLDILKPLRSNHQVESVPIRARLVPQAVSRMVVSDRQYRAVRVDLEWDGPPTGFVVEAEPPFQLVRFRMGDLRGDLTHVERRAYWDRSWPSGFHKPDEAP